MDSWEYFITQGVLCTALCSTYVVLAGGEVGGLGPVGGVVVPAAVEREVHGDGHDAGLVPAQTCRRCLAILTILGEGTCLPACLQRAPDCVQISCRDNLFKCHLKDFLKHLKHNFGTFDKDEAILSNINYMSVPADALLPHPDGVAPPLEVEVGVLLPSPIDVLPTLPNQVSPYPEVSLILQNLLLYLHSSSVTYCSSPLVDAISLGM